MPTFPTYHLNLARKLHHHTHEHQMTGLTLPNALDKDTLAPATGSPSPETDAEFEQRLIAGWKRARENDAMDKIVKARASASPTPETYAELEARLIAGWKRVHENDAA